MQKIFLGAIALTIVLMAGLVVADEATTEFGGYCPVAYAVMNKAVKGDPDISMDFAGKHYAFANTDAKKMFEADPSKYRVAYDGYCATAVGMGKKLDSDPTIFTVDHGVTYLFSSADAKKMFEADAHKAVAMADKKWAEINPAYGGYCPVAYVAMNKAIPGSPDITTFRDGELILLANDQAYKMFKAEPAKYSVAYNGYCATAMAMGKKYPSDPTIFTVKDGVTYLFSSAEAKEMFDGDTAMITGKADEQWASNN
jgi:YHS domain-containing protein